MTKLDPNRLATLIAVVALVLIAAIYGYRLQIGLSTGLIFENTSASER